MEAVYSDIAGQQDLSHILARLATAVAERRMEQPAILFLEMYKPLAGVAHTLLCMSYPIIVPLFGAALARKALLVLESPANIEVLLQMIEEGLQRRSGDT